MCLIIQKLHFVTVCTHDVCHCTQSFNDPDMRIGKTYAHFIEQPLIGSNEMLADQKEDVLLGLHIIVEIALRKTSLAGYVCRRRGVKTLPVKNGDRCPDYTVPAIRYQRFALNLGCNNPRHQSTFMPLNLIWPGA